MTEDPIEALRRFNRFYTRRIGVLHEGLLDSPFSLTESRLLWELAHRDDLSASRLAEQLELDPGYLSRLLAGFKARGLVQSVRSNDDARRWHLRLTAAGRTAFAPLDARSRSQAGALLAGLDPERRQHLLRSMADVERLLDPPSDIHANAPITLREHGPGDIGWIVARHGALYAAEHGLDGRFEALVARIGADFIERFQAGREACWIAERQGERLGSVMLVQARDAATQAIEPGIAQLRLLLIEPAARGAGLGVRLVQQCERFARGAGYRKIVLWTQSDLLAARVIYARAGYVLMESEPHQEFGRPQVGERWTLTLPPSAA